MSYLSPPVHLFVSRSSGAPLRVRQNRVQRVYKHHYRGRPQRQIANRLGISVQQVQEWLKNDKWFYPWVDRVVVERALAGDAEAFWAMTLWERDILLTHLMRIRRQEVREEALGYTKATSRLTELAVTFGLEPYMFIARVANELSKQQVAA